MSGLENKDAIPEVAKKQGEKADELHRRLYPDQYPKEEGKPAEGTPAPGETPKPGEAPKPEDKPKEEVKEAPKPSETPKEEDWKQKYETLQGKYNAEVPQLHMTVASLQNSIKQMQGEMASLKTAKETPPSPKEEPVKKEEPAPGNKAVDALRDEYPDIYEGVAAMIAAAKVSTAAPAKGEDRPVEKPKAEPPPPASTDPRKTFSFYLNRDVPDWQQVNVDPEFIKFLEAPDPNFPGMTKLQSIQAGYESADFTTVIGHFKDFKASKASKAAPAEAAPSNPDNPANPDIPSGKTLEERSIAPPRGGRGGAPPASATLSVTPADLKKFYADAQRGLWGPITGEKYLKEEARLLGALTGKKT